MIRRKKHLDPDIGNRHIRRFGIVSLVQFSEMSLLDFSVLSAVDLGDFFIMDDDDVIEIF